MDDAVTSQPSIRLKTLVWLGRGAWAAVIVAGVTLALAWGVLYGFIVPRIGELRPQLEYRVSQALGLGVRIGGIQAKSDVGLFPTLELTDVRLMDAQGRAALSLPRVLAVLSPRSLWNLGFEQLYIDQAELDIRRSPDGRILVAGLDLGDQTAIDDQAADWFFSQTELILRNATLNWTDELRQTPSVTFTQIDLALRNTRLSHAIRLDATPPQEWGERFTLSGQFRQPLLSSHPGRWQQWEGQVYGLWSQVDLARLWPHLDFASGAIQGRGALRMWMDVREGRLSGGMADVALQDLSVATSAKGPPLVMRQFSGRVSGQWWPQGFALATQDLQFQTDDGLVWPGGNLSLRHEQQQARVPEQGEIQADRLDLAALTRILSRLETPATLKSLLEHHAPRGLVEQVRATWQGPLGAPGQYSVRGRVRQLALAARPASSPVVYAGKSASAALAPMPGLPGVQGATLDFDFNQSAGKAQLQLTDGQLEFPGLFDEPTLSFTQLSTDVLWQQQAGHWRVTLPNLRFANADAQGEAQVKWQTADAAPGTTPGGLPGVLDMQGSMSRVVLARVARYMPLQLPADVRDYVRQSVRQGQGQSVKFRVKGDLQHFPFADPRQGDFRLSASLRDLGFVYVPRYLQPAQARPWPALQQASAELLMERNTLQVRQISGRLAGLPTTRILKAEVSLADYLQWPVVQVDAQARGPLQEWLGGLAQGSPLAELVGPPLTTAQGFGAVDLDLKLKLPVADLSRLSVLGRVSLPGNDLQIAPDIPRLGRARGLVYFTEAGFAVSGLTARVLGGEARAEGGTIAPPGVRAAGPLALRIQGTLTADGLRQAREWPWLAALGQQATGSTPYALTLAFKRDTPELHFSSALQGLGLNLPAPLGKPSDAALPIRVDSVLTPESLANPTAALQDQLTVDLGRLGSAVFLRSLSGPQPRVLRGALAVGLAPGEGTALPTEGVQASISLPTLDLDAWSRLLNPSAVAASPASSPSSAASLGYLPNRVVLRAQELTLAGRTLNRVTAAASRETETWRINLDAQQLSGYLEYRQASAANPGRIYARLARLAITQTAAGEVEALLDEPTLSIPALDIVVDDLELRGKKLGRVEIEATNRSGVGATREWRLNKFNIVNPEAAFTGTGNWLPVGEPGARPPSGTGGRTLTERRRTVLNFKLELSDAGELLARLGMKDVIRRGRGRMEGQLSWLGSPLALDYPSLGGSFNVNVETGQFLKADPGIAKLLGVLSLQALPRRLSLDFRDVFSEGFSFDFVRGDVLVDKGIASTNNLQMKGVNAAVLMEGRADVARETQELKVVVVPDLNAGTASLIATWINPTVGLGSFLAQWLLRRPLTESATQEFRVTGSWSDPKVVRSDTAPEPKRGASR